MAGEEVATCPSCSLVVKVIYDVVSAHSLLSINIYTLNPHRSALGAYTALITLCMFGHEREMCGPCYTYLHYCS